MSNGPLIHQLRATVEREGQLPEAQFQRYTLTLLLEVYDKMEQLSEALQAHDHPVLENRVEELGADVERLHRSNANVALGTLVIGGLNSFLAWLFGRGMGGQ